MDTLSDRIIILINENDLSHREFSKRAGISKGSIINALDGGSMLNGRTLVKITQAFDISVDWLLGLSDRRTRL